MKKYLYGAAVQGIQGFIFQTNRLRDIVGASEQVELICTKKFKSFVETVIGSYDEDAVVIHAAGNIKYEFSSKADCEKVVRQWPKYVVEYAPGITISQAVVEYDKDTTCFADVISELEMKLRAQRNKPMTDINIGLMGIHRSRTTNLPAIEMEKEDFLDRATFNKLYHHKWDDSTQYWRKRTTLTLCKKAFGDKDLRMERIAFDTDRITDKNDWIAVIHADGNGLGQIVQQIGSDRTKFKTFSKQLDEATQAAAVVAYHAVEKLFEGKKIIPIRPIVLGGDDFSVICRGDLALPYVAAFIQAFEEQTQSKTGHQLTACAGIAYIKSSFPFYYGYELAESLCSYAKKDAKQIDADHAPSCLMFHKVQDSFVESYEEIALRELQPQKGISLQYGPYYLHAQTDRWTINDLEKAASKLAKEDWNPVKTALRQWLTLLHDNAAKAEQKSKRIMEIVKPEQQSLVRELTQPRTARDGVHYPAYEVLAMHTLTTQVTHKEEKTE